MKASSERRKKKRVRNPALDEIDAPLGAKPPLDSFRDILRSLPGFDDDAARNGGGILTLLAHAGDEIATLRAERAALEKEVREMRAHKTRLVQLDGVAIADEIFAELQQTISTMKSPKKPVGKKRRKS